MYKYRTKMFTQGWFPLKPFFKPFYRFMFFDQAGQKMVQKGEQLLEIFSTVFL